MKKIYSEEQKTRIVNKYLSGMTITQIHIEYGISRSTLYKWIGQSNKCKNQERKVNMREFFDLKQRCKQQEEMIEILQNAPCLVNSPLLERYNYIFSCSDEYSVNLLCKTMKVAKGSYYNHILRNKNENTLFEEKKRELTPIIEKIFHDNNQIYGASKIHAILKDRGYVVGQNTVADIMHENGWYSVGNSAKKLYYMNLERKENLLNQQFTVTRPDEVWVSDVTYFKYSENAYYICVIIDLFSRMVVGYKIGKTNSTQLVKSTFQIAYKARQPDSSLIFHTDRGGSYRSKAMNDYMRSLHITHSFSRAHVPYDNSVMESFFASLKREELYRTKYRSEADFRSAVDKYIIFYNTKRPHRKLQYKTPEQKEEEYALKLGDL